MECENYIRRRYKSVARAKTSVFPRLYFFAIHICISLTTYDK